MERAATVSSRFRGISDFAMAHACETAFGKAGPVGLCVHCALGKLVPSLTAR